MVGRGRRAALTMVKTAECERAWGPWTIVRVEAVRFFSVEEVARARSYHRPLYWAAAVDGAIQAGVLATFVWSGVGKALDPGSLPWWARTPAYAAIVIAVSAAVRTPGALWSGFIRERRWGFSTQRLRSWAADRCKAAVVNVVLASVLLLGLVALARVLPGWWAAPAAGGFALAAVGRACAFFCVSVGG
jgi:STE24 endopeptidase